MDMKHLSKIVRSGKNNMLTHKYVAALPVADFNTCKQERFGNLGVTYFG